MKTFNNIPNKKLIVSQRVKAYQSGNTQQLAVPEPEAARRITDANLHDNLKWLRNERDKFEKIIENKHDFLINQSQKQIDPTLQAELQQHSHMLNQIYAELNQMYTQLEQVNVAVHQLQLHITGKAA